MNNLDLQYQELLQEILDNGTEKEDRTGTGTISLFGKQIKHNMKEGFPLLTTKKVYFDGIVTELLWFLKGDTNIKWLIEKNCNIWTGDAYKKYLNRFLGHEDVPSIDWFSSEIVENEEFAKKFGDLGPLYGKQWTDWGGWFSESHGNSDGTLGFHFNGIDQIQILIDTLKSDPNSRRLMVNSWNVGELDQMTLPPCHYGFQCYVKDEKYLSLMWNQRSVDTFLGLPFNIASYGLLLEIIAKEVNMVPHELIGNLGDVHLYKNHIEQAKEQLTRKPYPLPKFTLLHCNRKEGNMVHELEDYLYHPSIKAVLSN